VEVHDRGDCGEAAPGRCGAGPGKTVGEAVKTIGVTETTYHRWRNEYGGLKLDQVKRLKELEAENSRLRRCPT
jgi:putative transposase